jgi:hypothetical protein
VSEGAVQRRPSGRDCEAEAGNRPGTAGNERIPGELIRRTSASNTLACAAPPLTPKAPGVGLRLKSNESELFDLLRHRPVCENPDRAPAIGAIRVP